jgi:hypothetical protein
MFQSLTLFILYFNLSNLKEEKKPLANKEERGQPHFDYLKSSSWYHWVTIDKMSLIEVFLKTIKNFLFDLILLFLINLGDLSIVLKSGLARQVDPGPG